MGRGVRDLLPVPSALPVQMGPAVRGSVAAAGLGTAFQGPVSAEEVTAHPQVQILAEVSQVWFIMSGLANPQVQKQMFGSFPKG